MASRIDITVKHCFEMAGSVRDQPLKRHLWAAPAVVQKHRFRPSAAEGGKDEGGKTRWSTRRGAQLGLIIHPAEIGHSLQCFARVTMGCSYNGMNMSGVLVFGAQHWAQIILSGAAEGAIRLRVVISASLLPAR
ncbi:hypothetical protein N7490_009810 [Penicillium lividum]|nr:hypothetical protein N7490_009810 [Penicillium lividum]